MNHLPQASPNLAEGLWPAPSAYPDYPLQPNTSETPSQASTSQHIILGHTATGDILPVEQPGNEPAEGVETEMALEESVPEVVELASAVLPTEKQAGPNDFKGLEALPHRDFDNGHELIVYLNAVPHAAAGTLFALLRNRLLRMVRTKVGARADHISPDDVLQEVFTAVAAKKQPISTPEYYKIIWGITAHKLSDAFRRVQMRPSSSLEAIRELSATDFAESVVADQKGHYALEDLAGQLDARIALGNLADKFNLQPVDVAILGNIAFGAGSTSGSYAEDLAEQFDSTAGAIRVRRHRLLNRLRESEELRARWLTS